MDGVIANALRMLFCVFLGVYLGAEWFAWICGYGLSVSTVVVSVAALLIVLCYTIWDIGTVIDIQKIDAKEKVSLIKQNKELEYSKAQLETSLAQLESMYKRAIS